MAQKQFWIPLTLLRLSLLLLVAYVPVSALSGAWLTSIKSNLSPWGVKKTNVEATASARIADNQDDLVNDFYNLTMKSGLADSENHINVGDDTAYDVNNGKQQEEHQNRPLKIVVMGGPASGKGTQCQRIAAEYDLVHLSTGDMLREAVRQQSDVGLKANKYMNEGELVPDDIMIHIVMERITQRDCQERGWLLDGFPRTNSQAKAMLQNNIVADMFLFLTVPDSVMIDRVVGRRIDPKTSKVYHMKYNPPPSNNGNLIIERLVQRSDDTIEKMTRRLQQFHRNVNAVQRHYKHILFEIDGFGSPESVFERIRQNINTKIREITLLEQHTNDTSAIQK